MTEQDIRGVRDRIDRHGRHARPGSIHRIRGFAAWEFERTKIEGASI
jgi:hypothetical protein